MNNSKIPILTSIIVAISLIAALYIGIKVAEGNYFNLGLCFALVVASIYVLYINKIWLFIALLISVLGFRIQPLGPALDPDHVAILLAAGFILSNFWKKTNASPNEASILQAFQFFNRAFMFFTIFLFVHSYVTYYYPSPEIVVGFGNLTKQYFTFWAPFAIVWSAVRFIRFLAPIRNPQIWIGSILLVGITCNLILRAYSTFVIGVGEKDLITDEMLSASVLYIPILNLTDNIFALRALSPLVALFGIVMLTSRNKLVSRGGQKVLWVSLVALGIFGSVLSMGRATMLITAFLVILCLAIRKHIAAVTVIFLLFVFLIVGLRVAYETDKDLVPFGMQRSLAMIPGMDMPEAKGDIDASSEWRWILATRAIDEWRSNARKFFIGRGVHSFSERDVAVIKLQGYFGAMDVGLRRGATHSAVTDLLVTVGLAGAVFYIIAFTGLIAAMNNLLKNAIQTKSISYDIVFVSLLFSVSMIPVHIFGGGGVYNIIVLVFCAALANIAAIAPSIPPVKKP